MPKHPRISSDCLESCKSTQHGIEIISAITQRGIADQQLAVYLYNLCAGLKQQTNKEGCSALHMSASCGRVELCRWLIKVIQADINKLDLESGFTPLHRSIFYGKLNVAVELIQLGADISLVDKDGLLPLDHALLDQEDLSLPPSDFSVWGSNNNYVLGMGSETSRSNPVVHEFFRKQRIIIKKVCIDKFHSVFLSNDGRVWAAGHGLGGRLGLISEQTALEPQQIKTQPAEVFKSISIGRDHTVFLAESGAVYACGLNTHHQLGIIPPPPKLVAPRRINLSKNYTILGVAAGRFHSVFWNKTLIFVCGLHAGQLGLEFSDRLTIDDPALVKSIPLKCGCEISHVATSTGATIVVTNQGEVYALSDYKVQKISSRLNEIVGNVQKISIVGGRLDPTRAQLKIKTDQSNEELKLAILGDNSVFVWSETRPNFARCQFSVKVSMKIVDIHFNLAHLALVFDLGIVYLASVKHKGKVKKTPEKKKLLSSRLHPNVKLDGTIFLNLKRVPGLYRAMNIVTDPEGENFAVLQRSPRSVSKDVDFIVPIAQSEFPALMADFLRETNEMGSLHDIVFEVGQQRFPAHKVIAAAGSKELHKLIKSLPSNEDTVHLLDTEPTIFAQILEYMYTGSCSLLVPGKCSERIMSGINVEGKFNPIVLLEDTARKLQVSELVKTLKYYRFNNGFIVKKPGDKAKKKIGYCLEPNDFRLISKSGSCALEKSIQEGDAYEMDLLKFENDQHKLATEIHLFPGLTAVKYITSRRICDLSKELYFVVKNECRSSFSRFDFPEYYDLTIETSDKCSIKVHKCVLLSKVEYFRCMLSGSWREMTAKNSIRLPFTKPLVEGLLDYIYTERILKSPADADAADFYKCLLVIANFMLLPGLKLLCEQSLSSILTLRNVVTLLQISILHSASQLKQFCFAFICQNIAELLDLRYLEALDSDILKELTDVYQERNRHLCWRHISPFRCDRQISEIIEFNKMCPPLPWNVFEDDDVVETICSPKSGEKPRKKPLPRTRKSSGSESRQRKSSRSDSFGSKQNDMETLSSIMKSIRLTDHSVETFLGTQATAEENEASWIKIEKVQSRLRLNSMAKNDPNLLVRGCEMTELVPVSRSAPINIPPRSEEVCDIPTPSLEDKQAFPSLGSCWSGQASVKLFNQPRSSDWKKGKPKKTVFSIGDTFVEERKVETPPDPQSFLSESPASPKSPWGCINSPTDTSLDSVMKQEKQSSSSGSKEVEMSFSEIIADEQKKRDNLEKMRSKPLSMIQMEDQAIEALLLFYNAKNCFDERITVRRVLETNIAAPTWITHR